MADIPLPQSNTDIYAFGFDKSLNREIQDASNQTVYNTYESTAAQNVAFGALAVGAQSSLYVVDPTKGFWMGSTKYETALFRVNMSGDVFARNITATSGNFTLGSVLLGSLSSTMTVSDLPAKDYYDVSVFIGGMDVMDTPRVQFNNDESTNYAFLVSDDFSTPTSGTNSSSVRFSETDQATGRRMIIKFRVSNPQALEKSVVGEMGAPGDSAGTVPVHTAFSGIWANTAQRISKISISLNSSNRMNAGSYMLVVGNSI